MCHAKCAKILKNSRELSRACTAFKPYQQLSSHKLLWHQRRCRRQPQLSAGFLQLLNGQPVFRAIWLALSAHRIPSKQLQESREVLRVESHLYGTRKATMRSAYTYVSTFIRKYLALTAIYESSTWKFLLRLCLCRHGGSVGKSQEEVFSWTQENAQSAHVGHPGVHISSPRSIDQLTCRKTLIRVGTRPLARHGSRRCDLCQKHCLWPCLKDHILLESRQDTSCPQYHAAVCQNTFTSRVGS
jgi:hypothetical protein